MYTINKLSLSEAEPHEDALEKYSVIFQFKNRTAELHITVEPADNKLFPHSTNEQKMLYLSSQTDGYHWLNFWLAQEPGATKLICEDSNEPKAILINHYNGIRLPWDSQGDKDPVYKLKDLRLDGITAFGSMRMHTLKVDLLFEAFGFEYEEEDKETCFLFDLDQRDIGEMIEKIASIIEPRFALAEAFFPEG